MERRRTRSSFLDKISAPFVPPLDPEVPIVNIRTGLAKLIKEGMKIINESPMREAYHDRLGDFYLDIDRRKRVNKYKEKHPKESERYGPKSTTAKELRVLRFIAHLLSYEF